MRTLATLFLTLAFSLHAKDNTDMSAANNYMQNTFQSGKLYIGGQPSYEELKDLKSQNVDLVINLRTQKEMDNLKFDESYLLEKAGVSYLLLPVDKKNGYTPELLDAFAKAFEAKKYQKVLMHCGSGQRASHLWAAYLVKHQGKDINEALDSVSKYGWWPLPIESLLEKELVVKLKEK